MQTCRQPGAAIIEKAVRSVETRAECHLYVKYYVYCSTDVENGRRLFVKFPDKSLKTTQQLTDLKRTYMKYASKMRILRGAGALRVKMGVTQEIFAQYLGIASSTVSMMERGQRPVPRKALQRLTEMEIAWASHPKPTPGEIPSLPPACTARQARVREHRQKNRKLRLSRANYELNWMKEQYNEVLEGFAHLELATQLHGKEPGSQQQIALQRAEMHLHAALSRCNEEAQSKLNGRIARLEIIIAGHEPFPQQEPTREAVEAPLVEPLAIPVPDLTNLPLPDLHQLFIKARSAAEVAA